VNRTTLTGIENKPIWRNVTTTGLPAPIASEIGSAPTTLINETTKVIGSAAPSSSAGYPPRARSRPSQ